ncbi:MAG: Glu/Leu/Phe/Val dehydrogenase, partial [Alphaproteobacteria bacterium]|nr:Glu/Leu/Phe/Val dehydrogenase [Alphaproteobacteria bacterium]
EAMAWIRDEIGRAVGLPRVLGGIPLDEIGATGYGLAIAAEVAAPKAGIALKGARVAVQGYGAVGRHAARFLVERGARLVAASDSRGTALAPGGRDLTALDAAKAKGEAVTALPGVERLGPEAIVGADCEIWIPAARPDVIDLRNEGGLRARLVLQGANIPIAHDAELALHRRGVLSIPDFIANAGGVIAAAVEYRGGTEAQALAVIAEKVAHNTAAVLAAVDAGAASPRAAAQALARTRVERAMGYRR